MIDSFKTMLPLAWRNIWRNPRRTAITLIVVSVGLWSILFFNSFMLGWTQGSKDTTLKLLLGSGQIHAEGYLDDPSIDRLMPPPDAALTAALNAPEVAHWVERIEVPGVVQSEYKTLPTTIMGVDPEAEEQISTLPGKIIEGRYLSGPDDDAVVLGKHLVKRLKTGLGRRVILMSLNTEGAMSEQSFDVVGIYDADQATEDLYVFTGLAAAQKYLTLEDQIAQIAFELHPDAPFKASVGKIVAAAPGLDVRDWKELDLFLASIDSYLTLFIYIWLGVVFSLMAIGIVNTQLMAVFERTREFGLLRALGMKRGRVLLMVSLENALLIGVGVLIGIALALLSIWSLRGGIDLSRFAKGLEMFQSGQVIYLDYHPADFVEFSLLIWLLGVAVALWPANRAAKSSPVEAMRHET